MGIEDTSSTSDESFAQSPQVTVWADLHGMGEYEECGPEQVAAYGAATCFEERTSLELYTGDLEDKTQEQLAEIIERMMRETSGRGHGSVLDQSAFTFVIKGLPRLATLQICSPQYLMHLQQSLRRASAESGYFLPEAILNSDLAREVVDTLNESFGLYEAMKKEGIPAEDARILLPLFTRTNIQTTGDARELMHLHSMSRGEHIPSIIRSVVEEMIVASSRIAPALMKERDTNYEVLAWYPSPQPFAFENETLIVTIDEKGKGGVALIDVSDGGLVINDDILIRAIKNRNEAELANLKSLHYVFLVEMSLMSLHQALRQRTWDQSVEPIYHAVERGDILIPPSISRRREWLNKYNEVVNKMIALYHALVSSGISNQEAVGVVPHCIKIYDLININGWNAIHSIGKRTCTEAQWEIREIGREMAGLLRPMHKFLERFVQPQGVVYGRCPERHSCGLCDNILAQFEP
jgi:thymidylate synthase ThyX